MSLSSPQLAAVRFETPRDHYLLDGLVYGATGAPLAYLFMHGLEDSAFGKHDVLAPLTGTGVQALYFNNRGHDALASIKQVADSAKGYSWVSSGSAREVFTDCPDDIAGAINLLKNRGARQIILVGHSTGCQKATYYLAQPQADPAVAGAVLICPLSDYAAILTLDSAEQLKQATTAARALVAGGRPMALLPEEIWDETLSAQRFLSLYTPDSPEEIFTYAQPDKQPDTLRAVGVPLLVIVAGADEYLDRPAAELAEWFKAARPAAQTATEVIEDSLHNLRGHEATIRQHIQAWQARL